MKKIFAGIVLPTLAAAAVIGSGFSIWFFGENQDKVSTEAGIAVDNILRIGEMGKNSSAVLHLVGHSLQDNYRDSELLKA